MSSVFEILR